MFSACYKILRFTMTKRPWPNYEPYPENLAKRPKLAKRWGVWGLEESVKDPNFLVESDELVDVIKDKFPKAKFHYLVIPKESINTLRSLTAKHVDLVSHMEKVANNFALKDQHKGHDFRLGFHAIPSMSRLHLHVISDDMISSGLKTKKHWNSFTTNYFIPPEDVLKDLKKDGKVSLPSKKTLQSLMATQLQCHKCDFQPKTMPELKNHILSHRPKQVPEISTVI